MRPFFVKLVIPCMALAAASSQPASASPEVPAGYEVVTRRVSYADLDLTRKEGVETLYSRIRVAANEVCDLTNSRLVGRLVMANRCKQEAIGRAVEDANLAELTTFHLSMTNPVGDALRY